MTRAPRPAPAELMSARDFGRARASLGLSARELAEALGLAPTSERNMRRYEQGTRPVPPRVARDVRLLLGGFRPPYYPQRPARSAEAPTPDEDTPNDEWGEGGGGRVPG